MLGTRPAANTPTAQGNSVSGKISWFGGPNDKTSGHWTASGEPVSRPGIAIYNTATLKGYWLLKGPSSNLWIVKQTDIGPAPWTGRTIDYTYTLVKVMGYTEQNFPTDASAEAVYLGRTIDNVNGNIEAALKQLGEYGALGTFLSGGDGPKYPWGAPRSTLTAAETAKLTANGYLKVRSGDNATSPFFGFGPNTQGTIFGGPNNNYVQSLSDFFKNFSLVNALKILGGGILLLLGIYIMIKGK